MHVPPIVDRLQAWGVGRWAARAVPPVKVIHPISVVLSVDLGMYGAASISA